MIRISLTGILLFIVLLAAGAKVSFTIRYFDKRIYYQDDEIKIKVTISNESAKGNQDVTFYLSDNPMQSFGFNLSHLNGQEIRMQTDRLDLQDRSSPYQIINLKPGQEISMNISLGGWVDLSKPGQYRIFGYFYPKLRDGNNEIIPADSILNLSILPKVEDRWKNELTEEVRKLLISRKLTPLQVVKEALESRKFDRNYRAALYLDFNSLGQITKQDANSLQQAVERGSWKDIPGFLHPYSSFEFISSQATNNEAQVNINLTYSLLNQEYARRLRIYLHRPDEYWKIRRIDNINESEVYKMPNLSPPQVVRSVINSVKQGDWEIALSHFDITDMVSRLPENIDIWNNIGNTEKLNIIKDYKQKLITGNITENMLPLNEIDSWEITGVDYNQRQGLVVLESKKQYLEGNSAFYQNNEYMFYLQKPLTQDGQWKIIRYETAIIRRQ